VSRSANDTVQLSYRQTEDEYLAALRSFFWKSTAFQTRVIVSWVLVSAGLVTLVLLLGFSPPVWTHLILIAITGVALFHGYVVDLPRKYFRGDPKFRDEFHLTFTDAGIEFHTQNMSSMIAWNFYSGVVENDSFYILTYGRNILSLSIIPKRAFQSSDQEITFRQLLRRNLDPTLKLSNGEHNHQQYIPQHSQPPDWR